MKYEVFERILLDIDAMDKKTQKLYDDGVDLLNIIEPYNQAIWHLFGAYYGKSGKDWIEWFIYEKDGRKGITAHDSRGNEICKTQKELWKIIEKERTDDYVLPKMLSEKERKKVIEDMLDGFTNLKLSAKD